MRNIVIFVSTAAIVVIAFRFLQPAPDGRAMTGDASAAAIVDVTLPGDLSTEAMVGKALYDANGCCVSIFGWCLEDCRKIRRTLHDAQLLEQEARHREQARDFKQK